MITDVSQDIKKWETYKMCINIIDNRMCLINYMSLFFDYSYSIYGIKIFTRVSIQNVVIVCDL